MRPLLVSWGFWAALVAGFACTTPDAAPPSPSPSCAEAAYPYRGSPIVCKEGQRIELQPAILVCRCPVERSPLPEGN